MSNGLKISEGPQQMVQNFATRLVSRTRIQYKVILLSFEAVHCIMEKPSKSEKVQFENMSESYMPVG
jgi:hypothetical protein